MSCNSDILDGCAFTVGGIDVNRFTCRGDDLDDDEWMSVWNTGRCTDIYQCIVYSLDGEPVWNPQCLSFAQDDLVTVFTRYLNTYNIASSGEEGYSSMQENLLDACRTVPGICFRALNEINNGKLCVGKTEMNVASDPPLLEFCGCFVGPDLPERQCEPLCNRIGNVPVSDLNNGVFVFCNRPVCAITNTNITATESLFGTDINLIQVCPGCPNGGCDCIISASEDELAKINDSVNITQVCDKCFLALGNTAIPVECKGSIPTTDPDTSPSINIMLIVIIVLAIFFVFLVLFFLIIL